MGPLVIEFVVVEGVYFDGDNERLPANIGTRLSSYSQIVLSNSIRVSDRPHDLIEQ